MKDNSVAKDSIYSASRSMIDSTPRKLNLVAELIRGESVASAVQQLKFCRKRAAADVLKVLESAAANAEHNFNANFDDLYVKSVYIGKSVTLRRFRARARGRAARILKRYGNVKVNLCIKKEC